MILSILYKATPDEVRFLMVDPKMLELSLYEGIPHLLLPPVTDPKKAATALRWAVEEMERRYQMLAETGVRDIVGYNKKIDKLREAAGLDKVTKAAAQTALGVAPEATAALPPATDAAAATPPKKRRVMIKDERNLLPAEPILDAPAAPPGAAAPTVDANSATPATTAEATDAEHELTEADRARTPDQIPERLPYIVVVVDEFADLMMVASRDVETYIARLAQKARACGIHLLLATQRPSTDVITGVIKANFPVRMSFQVASNHDSRTIINSYGAEKLLGRGDMLLIPPGTSALLRCHGAFVSDDEIKRVVDFLKAQGAPHYDENILRGGEDSGETGDASDEEYDEFFDQAVAIVAETRQVSISMIQRRLKIGYNRAARIVERMEKDGLVGPQYPGNKPREVFVAPIAD
jgi:S-DNA-T family DNA segregation ATPase FtsK/SpoIIIE